MLIYKIINDKVIITESSKVVKGFSEWVVGKDRKIDNLLSNRLIELGLEKKIKTIRNKRAPLIEEADIEINKLIDAGLPYTEWSEYRQALRDITKQNPDSVIWPNKPI